MVDRTSKLTALAHLLPADGTSKLSGKPVEPTGFSPKQTPEPINEVTQLKFQLWEQACRDVEIMRDTAFLQRYDEIQQRMQTGKGAVDQRSLQSYADNNIFEALGFDIPQEQIGGFLPEHATALQNYSDIQSDRELLMRDVRLFVERRNAELLEMGRSLPCTVKEDEMECHINRDDAQRIYGASVVQSAELARQLEKFLRSDEMRTRIGEAQTALLREAVRGNVGMDPENLDELCRAYAVVNETGLLAQATAAVPQPEPAATQPASQAPAAGDGRSFMIQHKSGVNKLTLIGHYAGLDSVSVLGLLGTYHHGSLQIRHEKGVYHITGLDAADRQGLQRHLEEKLPNLLQHVSGYAPQAQAPTVRGGHERF